MLRQIQTLRQSIEHITDSLVEGHITADEALDRICEAIGKTAEGMPHCTLEEHDTLDANINNATRVQLESDQAYWQKELGK